MDHAATTYVDEDVLEAMLPYWKARFGNPSSVYESGRSAKAALEESREIIANLLNAKKKNEVYFTSCGTESNNWAIKGAAQVNRNRGKHIVTTAVEHHAILHPMGHLEREGFDITYLQPDRSGMISPAQVEEAIQKNTILVSVMYANNEVGTINPIAEIGQACRERGVLFHTDAVQAAGVLPIDVARMNVDMLSASAHKFYGPKGIGFLYIRNGVIAENLLHGGGQERKKRAGTENVAFIVGMAKAFSLAYQNAPVETRRIAGLRDYMIREITSKIPKTQLNGHPTMRLPGNVNIVFRSVEAQASLISLDLAGIECSSGSACSSGSVDVSHVLLAMGLAKHDAKCSLRFSLGHTNNREQVDYVVSVLEDICRKLRA